MRGTRRKSGGQPSKLSKKDSESVANVNKKLPESTIAGKSNRKRNADNNEHELKKVAKNKTKAGNNKVTINPQVSLRTVGEQSNDLRESQETRSSLEEVELHEGDNLVTMTVPKGDTNYCESKTSVEDEGDKHLDTSQESDGEILDSDKESEHTPQAQSMKSREDCQREIEQIDREFEEKIKELHEIVKRKGMDKSADLLQDCLTTCREEGLGKKGNTGFKTYQSWYGG